MSSEVYTRALPPTYTETLRDTFARTAMHALLLDGEEGVQNLSGPLPSIIAELAYDMAEVMIQERMKRLMQRQETRHQELLALADLSENRGGK